MLAIIVKIKLSNCKSELPREKVIQAEAKIVLVSENGIQRVDCHENFERFAR